MQKLEQVSELFLSLTEESVAFNREVFDFIANDGSESAMHIKCRRYIDFLLSVTQQIFTTYTDGHCAVCVKLLTTSIDSELNDDSSGPDIYTLIRDRHVANSTRLTADSLLRSYPFSENYAFVAALSGSGYFHSNNLKEMALDGVYHNAREDWRTYYNATAVIALREPKGPANNNVIGFLCVDNMTGGFDDSLCKSLLGIVSFLIYDVLQMTTYLESQRINLETGRQ